MDHSSPPTCMPEARTERSSPGPIIGAENAAACRELEGMHASRMEGRPEATAPCTTLSPSPRSSAASEWEGEEPWGRCEMIWICFWASSCEQEERGERPK